MKAAPVPRWAMSLAELVLLLLGFFILLHVNAARRDQMVAGISSAFADRAASAPLALDMRAATLFEPGEARLTNAARARLRAIGADAARSDARVRVQSEGKDGASGRFDGWELAAARVAASARAVEEGGLAEDRIDVTMPAIDADSARGHRIRIALRR